MPRGKKQARNKALPPGVRAKWTIGPRGTVRSPDGTYVRLDGRFYRVDDKMTGDRARALVERGAALVAAGAVRLDGDDVMTAIERWSKTPDGVRYAVWLAARDEYRAATGRELTPEMVPLVRPEGSPNPGG